MSEPVLSLSEAGLSLNGNAGLVEILHAITLDVQSGESLGLIGPSGSGKSSLLMLMGGLETATTGKITALGQDLTPEEAMRELSHPNVLGLRSEAEVQALRDAALPRMNNHAWLQANETRGQPLTQFGLYDLLLLLKPHAQLSLPCLLLSLRLLQSIPESLQACLQQHCIVCLCESDQILLGLRLLGLQHRLALRLGHIVHPRLESRAERIAID